MQANIQSSYNIGEERGAEVTESKKFKKYPRSLQ